MNVGVRVHALAVTCPAVFQKSVQEFLLEDIVFVVTKLFERFVFGESLRFAFTTKAVAIGVYGLALWTTIERPVLCHVVIAGGGPIEVKVFIAKRAFAGDVILSDVGKSDHFLEPGLPVVVNQDEFFQSLHCDLKEILNIHA